MHRVLTPPSPPPSSSFGDLQPTPESDQGDHEGRVDDEEGEEEGKVEEGGEDQKSGDAGQQHHQRAASGKKGEGSVVRDSETTALPSSAVAPGGGSGEDGALDAAAVDGDPGGEDDLSSLELPESLVAQLREARAQVRREREEAERARAGGKGVGTLPEAQRSAADETRGEAEVEAGAAVGSVEEHDAGAAAERPSPPAAGVEVGAAQAAPEAAPDRPQPRHGEAVTTSAAKGPSVCMLGPGDVRRKQTPRALSLLLQVPDVDADSVRPVFCDTEVRLRSRARPAGGGISPHPRCSVAVPCGLCRRWRRPVHGRGADARGARCARALPLRRVVQERGGGVAEARARVVAGGGGPHAAHAGGFPTVRLQACVNARPERRGGGGFGGHASPECWADTCAGHEWGGTRHCARPAGDGAGQGEEAYA